MVDDGRVARLENKVGELHKMAQEDREWRLGFWSNGSDRPLGFFQNRIRQDDERYARIESCMREIGDEQTKGSKQLQLLVDRETQAAERRKNWLLWTRFVVLPIVLLIISGIGWLIKAGLDDLLYFHTTMNTIMVRQRVDEKAGR